MLSTSCYAEVLAHTTLTSHILPNIDMSIILILLLIPLQPEYNSTSIFHFINTVSLCKMRTSALISFISSSLFVLTYFLRLQVSLPYFIHRLLKLEKIINNGYLKSRQCEYYSYKVNHISCLL